MQSGCWLHGWFTSRRHQALFWLTLPHAFRHVGMVFLVPGVVARPLPEAFAIPAAYGDLLTGVLALIGRCCTARSKSLTSLCRLQSHPAQYVSGHPERSHLVEYLAPNSVFNSLPRQRSSPHLRPDERLVTIDRVLHHAFAWCSLRACTIHVGRVFRLHEYGDRAPAWRCSNSD